MQSFDVFWAVSKLHCISYDGVITICDASDESIIYITVTSHERHRIPGIWYICPTACPGEQQPSITQVTGSHHKANNVQIVPMPWRYRVCFQLIQVWYTRYICHLHCFVVPDRVATTLDGVFTQSSRICSIHVCRLDLYSLSGRTSYRKIS